MFGASTGAAAALVAAAQRSDRVAAVVSRGGRPDLAGPALARVLAPTLLIVGGADTNVLALNRRAAARLAAEHRLEVVPGAGHLFEEPGALDVVARLAAAWFAAHLGRRPADTSMGLTVVAGERPSRNILTARGRIPVALRPAAQLHGPRPGTGSAAGYRSVGCPAWLREPLRV